MDLPDDTADCLPIERVPSDVDRKIERSDCLSRQNAVMRQTLSRIFERYPHVERAFTKSQLEQAKPIYAITDAADTLHWTFEEP